MEYANLIQGFEKALSPRISRGNSVTTSEQQSERLESFNDFLDLPSNEAGNVAGFSRPLVSSDSQSSEKSIERDLERESLEFALKAEIFSYGSLLVRNPDVEIGSQVTTNPSLVDFVLGTGDLVSDPFGRSEREFEWELEPRNRLHSMAPWLDEASAANLLQEPESWLRAGGGAAAHPVKDLLDILGWLIAAPRESKSRTEARRKLDERLQSIESARETIDFLLSELCGSPPQHLGNASNFRFSKGSIRVNLVPMSDEIDNEKCIEGAVERIRAAVADLPNVDDVRQAEVQALIGTVSKDDSYPRQIEAFTGITHTMRVQMARRLEGSLRVSLLANPASTWVDQMTDDMFRLGLALQWKACPDAAYLGVHNQPNRTRYRICRVTGGGGTLGTVTSWGAAGRSGKSYAEQLSLQDAAPPQGQNSLRPSRKR